MKRRLIIVVAAAALLGALVPFLFGAPAAAHGGHVVRFPDWPLLNSHPEFLPPCPDGSPRQGTYSVGNLLTRNYDVKVLCPAMPGGSTWEGGRR